MTGPTTAPGAPFACTIMAAAMAATMLATAVPSAAATYQIDKKHTEVRFSYTVGFSTQHGRFTSVEGNVEYEPTAPGKTTVQAIIATGSLTTGEPLVDQTLKGSDFFNVEEQPRMTFTSRSVRSTGAETAEMT